MAGLFDLIQSGDPAVNNGLLNFGLSLLQSKGSFGNAVGRAGQVAQLGARDYRQQEELLKRTRLNDELLQMQLEQQQKQVAEQARMQELAKQFYRTPQQQAMMANSGPTVAAANAAESMPGGFDKQGYMQALYAEGKLPMALQMEQLLQKQAPKLSRMEVMRGPDGSLANVAVFEDGTTKVLPFGVKPEIALQNLGSKTVAIDKNAVKGGDAWSAEMTPAERDASNRARERLNFDRGQSTLELGGPDQALLVKRFGKPEAGRRWKPDGSLEIIPGSSADIKSGAEGEKREARARSAMQQSQAVLDSIDKAEKLVSWKTAGMGGLLANLPATEARDLQGELTTIKANLGFDRLQQMREQSPTGGALGQVAVQELTALQATVASLDQLRSVEQLQAALAKIRQHYQRWQETLGGSTGGATGGFDDPAKEQRYQEWKKRQNG